MRFGLSLPVHGHFADPTLHVGLAILAEESGWDGYFLWDHIAWKNGASHTAVTDPWITLAAIAARTERLLLGPMVTPLARRRPWKVAREAVALDHLSDGRTILGVGLGAFGKTEFQSFGDEGNAKIRGRMLDEAIDVITGLWRAEPFAYDGEFYQVDDAHFMPAPVQRPRIPIWVAGTWRNNQKQRPFRRAARYDGSFPLVPGRAATPEDFAQIGALISRHRTSPEPMELICGRAITEEGIGHAAQIRDFADVGVTWWMPGALLGTPAPDEVRRLIRLGPPKSALV